MEFNTQKGVKLPYPDEVFTGMTKRTKSKSDTFRIFHPFGCPVYVLDKRLADGSSAPKWNPRSRVGIFLVLTQDHARNVAW
eukprot:10156992-Ditylum_brightwellii.AAC.1